jgi:hypothetical protein
MTTEIVVKERHGDALIYVTLPGYTPGAVALMRCGASDEVWQAVINKLQEP